MRTILKAIAALLPLAALAPTHAVAADAWRQSCSGAEFVCGSAAKPALKAAKASAQKPAKVAKVKAKKATAVSANDAPVKANVKAKKKVASVTKAKAKVKIADAPVKAKKAKVAKAAKSSGGGSAFQSGVASWYGGNFHGRKTANGETYNMNAWTAAHKTLPFGTRVRVTNTRNGDTVDVRINDRGPFIAGRIIDLSRAAAADIGVTSTGVAPVKITILGKG